MAPSARKTPYLDGLNTARTRYLNGEISWALLDDMLRRAAAEMRPGK